MSCLGRIIRRVALFAVTVVALVAVVRWAWAPVTAYVKTWACTNITYSLCEAP
jgi:hypothetical protein